MLRPGYTVTVLIGLVKSGMGYIIGTYSDLLIRSLPITVLSGIIDRCLSIC